MQNYSTYVGWFIPVARAMTFYNLDFEGYMKRWGIDPKCMVDQESRLEIDKFAELVDFCNKTLNRKDFAIEIAKQSHPGMFHALGYAMMCSNSLADALERVARYKRVVSNTCVLTLQDEGDIRALEMTVVYYEDSGRPTISQPLVEGFLATILQFSRELISHKLVPERVEFSCRQPSFDYSYLSDYFGCDVLFEQPRIALVFDKSLTDAKLLAGNSLIAQVHEKILDELLYRIDKHDLTYQIKNRIYETLPMGTPTQADIASYLGMSIRNLQRKLNEKGTSYKDLLESTRKKLAMDYIQQHHLSLSEVGYLVGFSSVGNFNRAFKRWTEKTPGEFRAGITV